MQSIDLGGNPHHLLFQRGRHPRVGLPFIAAASRVEERHGIAS